MRIAFGIFLLLHSLVHLLYFGHSAGFFALKPGLTWPSGSLLLSRGLGEGAIKNLASVLLILAAMLFAAGGIGIFAGQSWWRSVVVGAAIFSSLVYILFWNGKLQNLDGQGGVGFLIDIAILLVILLFHWPELGL